MSGVISTQPLPSESVNNQAELEEGSEMQERLQQQQQNIEEDVCCCPTFFWVAECTESCCELLAECIQCCCNDSSGDVGRNDNDVDCGCCDCDFSD